VTVAATCISARCSRSTISEVGQPKVKLTRCTWLESTRHRRLNHGEFAREAHIDKSHSFKTVKGM
jgi:hypothetical protein